MSHERIVVDPKVMLGKPVVRGTRIPVEILLRKLSEGASVADLLDAYPRLTTEDVLAALAYAADTIAIETTVSTGDASGKQVLRFLVDECTDDRLTSALRTAGHDVLLVGDVMPAAPDENVATLAQAERRVLVTEDRDFGRLAYALHQGTHGVLLVRWPGHARAAMGQAVVDVVRHLGEALAGALRGRDSRPRPGTPDAVTAHPVTAGAYGVRQPDSVHRPCAPGRQ